MRSILSARTSRRAVLGGLAMPALLARPAEAAWPERPISWVLPFPSGGITDTQSRHVAQRMSQLLGQPVVVDNRPGASGSIGTENATRAAPDGYTVLYGSVGTLVVQPLLHPKLRYDPVRDFKPVHGLGTSPNMLVVPASRPWRTVAELVEGARAKPEALNYGTSGIGTSLHLCGALLQTEAAIRMNHVPYVNYSQMMNDLIAGRLDCVFDYPLTAVPHVREGRLRALGVTDPRRALIAPEVPTMAEAGFPAVELSSWSGLFLPARTPEPIVTAVTTATARALRDPKVVEFFNGSAIELWPEVGPDRLRALLSTEIVRIRELLERSGATSS